MHAYQILLDTIEHKGAAFLVLLDPDKQPPHAAGEVAARAVLAGADALLIGGSFLYTDHFQETLAAIKASVSAPVLLFPGISAPSAQIFSQADAILLLSLVSGRNPEYLIGEHVRSALWIDRCGLETIPTAYMLIESGATTSAEFFSGTRPIPRDKAEIAMIHALAAQQLGMKLVYLEAGSGATNPVPEAMITAVSGRVSIPVAVGGGIRDPDTARRKVEAGARIIVVGTAIEQRPELSLLQELAMAVHIST
ncbi:MAG: geranylgeranylglyceryl/heptaprenylglyceryl phosphate synthase [Chloroflexi bacterium]|nr:geranylgeranylglyceryl/heptaprenylglyceryl phosphate synthase [Chloroflexota bacterium]